MAVWPGIVSQWANRAVVADSKHQLAQKPNDFKSGGLFWFSFEEFLILFWNTFSRLTYSSFGS